MNSSPSPEEKPCDHCDFQERDERESNIARQAAAQAREDLLNEITNAILPEVYWTRVGDRIEYICPFCKKIDSASGTHPPYLRFWVRCGECGFWYMVKGGDGQRNSWGAS